MINNLPEAQKIVKNRMLDRADQETAIKAMDDGVETVWDRFASQQPQCGFGNLGVCCNRCAMGPCRTEPFGKKPTGVSAVRKPISLSHGTCLTILPPALPPTRITGAKSSRQCLRPRKAGHRGTRSMMKASCTWSRQSMA